MWLGGISKLPGSTSAFFSKGGDRQSEAGKVKGMGVYRYFGTVIISVLGLVDHQSEKKRG
jgi:hypothetical protein